MKSDAEWNIADVLAKTLNIKKDVAINLIAMMEKEECTIPFIARYRREKTGGMDPDNLRYFSTLLEELRAVQKKSKTMIQSVQKQGLLDLKTELSLLSAQSMEELELAYAPFKGEKKTSLANRARLLGLGEAASSVLAKPNQTDLRRWVVKGTEGRATLSEVETGVKHVVADILSKEKVTMEKVREIFHPRSLTLESKLVAKKTKKEEENNKKSNDKFQEDQNKYQLYFEFSCRVNNLRSHQVLAINRGEAQKFLSVKVLVAKDVETRFLNWSRKYWLAKVTKQDALNLVKCSIEDSYTRLIKPFVVRRTRSDLLKKAQLEAVEIFSKNLKRLLLTPPLRGKAVLGVDPGFKNGCKCAVVSSTGNEILATDIINLNSTNALRKIKQLHNKHKFDVIGIGNGTACRETESLFSQFISKYRDLDLAYCIVNENGASIYSITPEAEKELPGMDPNLRSAVSIARRLQDPLIELVKIEPKHMGVGMYQHDIPENHLKTALDNVLEDCVTYVGVDLNVANEALLCRIAGLKKGQAKNIVERRNTQGNFVNRQQLRGVKGIGEKTFQQCAGFMRICHKHLEVPPADEPEAGTSGSKRKMKVTSKSRSKKLKLDWRPNPLDQTWIHPESYEIAERYISSLNLSTENLGQRSFIDSVKRAMYETGINKIAESLSTDVHTIQLIADGLSQEAGFRDIRNEMRRPIFRRGITSLDSLRVGTKLSGRVTNVTNFGAFVDIGVGHDGLMHQSDSGGNWEDLKRSLGPNDTVQVSVKHVDLQRKRIALRLIQADLCQTAFK